MAVKCQTIISLIEGLAPRRLAEEWDNVGLHVGSPSEDITGILVTLDAGPQVVEEARRLGANLIVSHHPLIFKGLKNVRADQPLGRLLATLIKNDINVYCAHTNLDSAREGVNQVLAELFGLHDIQILKADKVDRLCKLVVFTPESHADQVRTAITKAGAGWIGNYSDCTFNVTGTGTFKALPGANPFLGEVGTIEKACEIRLETVVRENQVPRVVRAMSKAHPYEEVAYDVYPLINNAGEYGLGRTGRLPEARSLGQFMDDVKQLLKVSTLRFAGDPEVMIEKVAVCGGSGAGFISQATFAGADVYLTGDLKYHDFQEAAALGLSVVDAGHFATELPVVAKLAGQMTDALAEAGIAVPVHISACNFNSYSVY